MRRTQRFLAGLVVALVSLAAPVSAQTPGVDSPPRLTVTSTEGAVDLVALRGCFGVLCYSDIPGPDEPLLAVPAGTHLTLAFAAALSPTSINVRRFDAQGNRAQDIGVPIVSPLRFTADFPAGIYRVDVSTTWAAGNADYSFRAQVAAAPTTTVSPPRPDLADSGAPTSAMRAWGLLLMGIGASVALGRRIARRRLAATVRGR